MRWYQRAAWQWDPEAAFFIGLSHQHAAGYPPGRAGKPSPSLAFYWFHEADGLGNAHALVGKGDFWLTGDEYNAPSAPSAVHWYEKAARRKVPRALESLARCYETGTGVDRDEAKARKLRKKAARLRERQALPATLAQLVIKDDEFAPQVRAAACVLTTLTHGGERESSPA